MRFATVRLGGDIQIRTGEGTTVTPFGTAPWPSRGSTRQPRPAATSAIRLCSR